MQNVHFQKMALIDHAGHFWTILGHDKALWGETEDCLGEKDFSWVDGGFVQRYIPFSKEKCYLRYSGHISSWSMVRCLSKFCSFNYIHCPNALSVRNGCVDVLVKTAVASDVWEVVIRRAKRLSYTMPVQKLEICQINKYKTILLKYSQLLFIYLNIFLHATTTCLLIFKRHPGSTYFELSRFPRRVHQRHQTDSSWWLHYLSTDRFCQLCCVYKNSPQKLYIKHFLLEWC